MILRLASRSIVSRRAALSGGAISLLAAILAGENTSSAAEATPAATVGGITVEPYEKVEPQKFPWGWIRWLMNAQIDPQAEMTLGLVEIEPHQSNPQHIHPNSAELMHVISGTCEQRIGDRWVTLKTGDTVRIPQGVPHSARTHDQAVRAVIVYNTGTRQMKVVE